MELTSGESFVLESMAANMAHPMIEQVIIEISKKDVLKTKWKNVAKNAMKNDFDAVDNHNQSLINQNKNTTQIWNWTTFRRKNIFFYLKKFFC